MANVVSTSTVAFSRGEDRPRGIPVAVCGVPAGFAPEGAFGEQHACLVSRSTLAARHGGVGGRYQHHSSACPLGILDQGPFRGTDSSVDDLARNFGLKSSTAMTWWSSTIRFAQARAVWVFCRVAFLWSRAACRWAFL